MSVIICHFPVFLKASFICGCWSWVAKIYYHHSSSCIILLILWVRQGRSFFLMLSLLRKIWAILLKERPQKHEYLNLTQWSTDSILRYYEIILVHQWCQSTIREGYHRLEHVINRPCNQIECVVKLCWDIKKDSE
jgi:hypothetical protein